MRKSKTIDFGGKQVAIQELTVEQVTNLLDALNEGERKTSTLDLLFPDGIPADAVTLSTGLAEADLLKYPPSELSELWAAVEEVNSFFAAMIGRLAALGRSVLTAGTSSAAASS